MLPIHYMAMGILNPIAFAALRMQAVSISFGSPEKENRRRLFFFALGFGILFGTLTLTGQIPAMARWYFGTVQNLVPQDIPLAMQTLLAACLIPVVQCLRGCVEGVAASAKRSRIILCGQAVHLATLVAMLSLTLKAGVPGHLMGAAALTAAMAATGLTVFLGLRGCGIGRKRVELRECVDMGG